LDLAEEYPYPNEKTKNDTRAMRLQTPYI